jgi:hypothetical protein
VVKFPDANPEEEFFVPFVVNNLKKRAQENFLVPSYHLTK